MCGWHIAGVTVVVSTVDRVGQMDSSHDAPAPSRGGRGDLLDGSLRDVIGGIQSHNLAHGDELVQSSTNNNKRRMGVEVEAGSAVGQNETDNNKDHSEPVPADDGAKRRRVDISAAAAAAAGDDDGHSGGGSVGAGSSQQQHQGGGNSLSASLTAPMQQPNQQPKQQPNQQQQQQHPVWDLFGAAQLRQLLSQWTTDHSLRTQAGLRWAANGQQLLTFYQRHIGVADLLAALCVTEEGGWDEIGEVIELAGQCRYCLLPVRLTADDLHQFPNKTAYLASPRVLAQLKMVGRHIDFGNGVRFQLFRHQGNTLRAVKDEDGFELTIDPPLPAGHLYQQHRQQHDPPVQSSIDCRPNDGWGLFDARHYSSVSSFVKVIIINHVRATGQRNHTSRPIPRHADNNRLGILLTQSSHRPVARCTTTTSYRSPGQRHLVLTDATHSFVACIKITGLDRNTVGVSIFTTEAPVCVGDAFKDRFPATTRLARAVLWEVIAAMIFGQ
ncbi:unnamed protein product [Vitrella brassicaformis CCMP3155]|uniref:Uncharacterized protein n=1 Tax=Vitrella brassicaformis (strain CCMP3155) TaxID=1169540 RepID=A0A0G4GKJ8_VITBC|nr:unnamed protein product [Vitrella brassicaformis CCMP3155]|eukprot:CEM30553.1 unnamed protein product [Vitrella brassicaformis CCMP3155]